MKKNNQRELEPWQEKLVLIGRRLQSSNDKKRYKEKLTEKSPHRSELLPKKIKNHKLKENLWFKYIKYILIIKISVSNIHLTS